MIKIAILEPGKPPRFGGAELLEEPTVEKSFRWIDVEGLGEERERFIRQLGLHPLVVEDVFTLDHQPKVEELEGALFMIARGIFFGEQRHARPQAEGSIETLKLAAYLTRDQLVTYHKAPMRSIETIRAKLTSGEKRALATGPAHLLYTIYEEMLDLYRPILDGLSERADNLEDKLFENPANEDLSHILDLRRTVVALRRIMLPHRQVFGHLVNAPEPILKREKGYFRDLFDKAQYLSDSIDQLREQVGSLRDTYLSLLGQRTNDVMKTLTVISAILLPLTFLAGLYGMNFAHMPELQQPYAYPILLGVMAVIAVGMVLWFRKRGWF